MMLLKRLRALTRPTTRLAPPAPPPTVADPQSFYVDEISAHHAAGWCALPGPTRVDAILPTGEILGAGTSSEFKFGPSHAGQGHHGFHIRLNRTLTQAEQADLMLRAPAHGVIAHRQVATSAYTPLMLVAMDIVDNCNLRCPFCVYDYTNVRETNFMTEETLAAALRLMPYTMAGNFWFSCLHEPSLHPRFTEFLGQVPNEDRDRVFFTTNLARRMPEVYFDFLAKSGVATINISIESRDPETYERFRKGARHRIFLENWDRLLTAFAGTKHPPFLRYIVMVYRTNLAEIPELVRYLVEERAAAQVQLRFTFDVPHIPQEFRETEYVADADWDWLERQTDHYPRDLVQVIRPPPAQSEAGVRMPGRYECKLSWDGTLRVQRYWAVPFDTAGEPPVAEVNVRDIADPLAFIDSLPR